jgi:hypothetical protein
MRRFAPEKWAGGLRPPYENRVAKTTPGRTRFFVLRRVAPEGWRGE